MTVPGVQGDQPSSSDACQQGAHVKDNRQVEVEGSHPVTVNKDADVGLLRLSDPVRGEQRGRTGPGLAARHTVL